MKLNLTLNSNQILSGYHNIDPYAEPNEIGKVSGPLQDLSWIADKACCTEIIAEDVVGYFPADAVNGIFEHWISRLRHKGTLIVGGIESKLVCRDYYTGKISAEHFNHLMYGEQSAPWQFRKVILSNEIVSREMLGMGLKIMKNRVSSDTYKFIIQAQRP